MINFAICASLCILSLSTYLIWWSKKNVFNHFIVGFCLIGYIIPCCIFDFDTYVDKSIIDLYIKINIVGVVFFLLGLILGYKWKSITIVNSVIQFSNVEKAIYSDTFKKRILSISKAFFTVSLVVIVLCFLYMGFVPLFAADPFSAKQFKGVYQPRYQHVALFYRTAKQFVQILLPILLINFLQKRKIKDLIMILCGMLLIFASLARSETITGLLLVASIMISMRKGRVAFSFYLVFLVIFFSVGSSFWVVLAYYFPNSGFSIFTEELTVAESIAAGAPDILDQLRFLNAFITNHVDYTYGLTFLGGLIPFNFKYNTSAWTLYVLNDTNDISEIASGGLRLPVTMWGYVCFGWFGVALLPFISAFFTGYITKKIKNIVNKLAANYNDYLIFYFLTFIYSNIGFVFTDFYRISIYYLPGFIFFGLIIYLQPKKVANLA